MLNDAGKVNIFILIQIAINKRNRKTNIKRIKYKIFQ